MSDLQKPRKRIVSRGKYAQILGVRTGLGVSSGVLISAGFVFTAATLVLAVAFVGDLFSLPKEALTLKFFLGWTVGLLCFAGVSALCFKLGLTANKQQKALRNVVPMTKDIIEAVPTPEMLVRASVEPIQEQQAVLLRAAAPTQDTHEEQLLRATRE